MPGGRRSAGRCSPSWESTMRDLAVITPSRGRPWHLQRLMTALADTCQLSTDLYVYADDDDPRLDDYKNLGLAHLETGPRDSLAALTNQAARGRAGMSSWRRWAMTTYPAPPGGTGNCAPPSRRWAAPGSRTPPGRGG